MATVVGGRQALAFKNIPGGLPAILDLTTFTGNVFFVDSNVTDASDTAGFGSHPDSPFATIDGAIAFCTANQGDVIFVLPGHTETISAAGGITIDKAGISIIGLGHGTARPTITFSATASTFLISAADALVKNIRTTCTGTTTKMFSVTGAGCTLDGVDYFEGSAIPLQFVLTAATSDQFTLKNSRHYGPTAGASAQLWIRLIGCDQPVIIDNTLMMDLENGATDAMISGDGSVVWFEVSRNTIVQTGGTTQVSAILFTDGATGIATHNSLAVGSTALAGICDVGNAGYAVENYALNDPDKSGKLDPTADS